MLDARWLRYASVTFLALVLSAAYVSNEHTSARQRTPDDFPVYYVAGKLALWHETEHLYNWRGRPYALDEIVRPESAPGSEWDAAARSSGFGSTLPFITPPFTALLFEPLARLPWPRAYLIWRCLTGLMVVLSVYFALRVAKPEHFLPLFAVFAAAALSFFPYVQTLWLGQIGGVILLSWALGVYFISRKQTVASALCFALGTLIKLTPLLAVGLFALRRQWRWLIAYAGWCGFFLLVSVWQLGWQNHLDWFRYVYPTLACGIPTLENRSLPAMISDIYFGRAPFDNFPASVPSFLCAVDKCVAAVFYLGALYLFWKKNKTSNSLVKELIVLASIALVVSPISWRHHFVLAILPLCYLWGTLPFSPQPNSRFAAPILAGVTLVLGVKAPEFALARIPILSIGIVSVWVLATILLICLGLKTCGRSDQESNNAGMDLTADQGLGVN